MSDSTFIRFKLAEYFDRKVKVAVSLPELVQQTNEFSVKNRPGCSPVLTDSDKDELYLDYKVTCNLKDSDPEGHDVRVKFDVDAVTEGTMAKALDVEASCSCPAFLWWGAQWNLHQRDALYGEPRPLLTAPTERLDLRGKFILCVAPGTLIWMADGTEKPIEDVVPGDQVITHLGRPRRVIAVSSRAPFVDEVACAVVARDNKQPLVTSQDHPYATVEWDTICGCGCSKKLTRESSACRTRDTRKRRFLHGHSPHKNSPVCTEDPSPFLSWRAPTKIRPGDYLHVPAFEWQGTKSVSSDLAALVGYYLAEGDVIYRAYKPPKGKRGRPARTSEVITVNGQTIRVWSLRFTLGVDEEHTIAADIVRRIKALVGQDVPVSVKERKSKKKKWLNVIVNHSGLACEMLRLAGMGSKHLRLSSEVLGWDQDSILEVAAAYALGDGEVTATGQQCLYTISPALHSQMSAVLFSLGIMHGRLYQDHSGGKPKKNRYHKLQWDCRAYPQLLDRMRNRLRPKALEAVASFPPREMSLECEQWKSGFMRVVRSVSEVDAPSLFHDLAVEDDESFIANGLVVHNCKHLKAVMERILPSVQHNIVKILRKQDMERRKQKEEQKKGPVKVPPKGKTPAPTKAPAKKPVPVPAKPGLVERTTPATPKEKERVPVLTDKVEPIKTPAPATPVPAPAPTKRRFAPVPMIEDLDEAPEAPAQPKSQPKPALIEPLGQKDKPITDQLERDELKRQKKKTPPKGKI